MKTAGASETSREAATIAATNNVINSANDPKSTNQSKPGSGHGDAAGAVASGHSGVHAAATTKSSAAASGGTKAMKPTTGKEANGGAPGVAIDPRNTEAKATLASANEKIAMATGGAPGLAHQAATGKAKNTTTSIPVAETGDPVSPTAAGTAAAMLATNAISSNTLPPPIDGGLGRGGRSKVREAEASPPFECFRVLVL